MLPTAALSVHVTAVFVVFATVAVNACVCDGVSVTLVGVSVTLTGTTAFSCIPKVLATPPALAVNVAVCVLLTADTVTVKPALVNFSGTVTVAGTATAALLLARLTVSPPCGAGPLSVTVQASVADPVSE